MRTIKPPKKPRFLTTVLLTGLLLLPLRAMSQDIQKVWCLKTDKEQLIEMSRVVMLASVDGQTTFEVVVRCGQGATGVKSVTFELHESNYSPEVISDDPPVVTGDGPWCLISDKGDSIAMSRVQMLANVDGSHLFEVITSDGANLVGVGNVYFGRGQSATSGNFIPIEEGDSPKQLDNPNNPWCLITSENDTIAMSRVMMLALADNDGKFEVVTTQGDNRTGVSYIRFAHGDTNTAGGFKEITSGTAEQLANPNNPWCLITSGNDTIAMSRVQMIANADANNLFEIVTSEGQNVTNVSYIRFAHGDTPTAGGFKAIDSSTIPVETGTGPWCLVTDRGDSIAVGRVSMLANVDASSTFEIITKYGDGKSDVKTIRFTRGLGPLSGGFDPNYRVFAGKGDANSDGVVNSKDITIVVNYIFGIEAEGFTFDGADANGDGVVNVADLVAIVNIVLGVKNAAPLFTAVRSQLSLSSCGDADEAIVTNMEHREMGRFPVVNGSTTLFVENFKPGAYTVEVGPKTIIFIKK